MFIYCLTTSKNRLSLRCWDTQSNPDIFLKQQNFFYPLKRNQPRRVFTVKAWEKFRKCKVHHKVFKTQQGILKVELLNFWFQLAQLLPMEENFLLLFRFDNPLDSSVEFMKVNFYSLIYSIYYSKYFSSNWKYLKHSYKTYYVLHEYYKINSS